MNIPKEILEKLKAPYIEELENFVEREIDGIFKVRSKKLQETKDGKKFLLLTLEDRTGSIRAVDWYNAEKNDQIIQNGTIVGVTGRVVYFEERLQINISNSDNALRKLNESEYDIERFVSKASNPEEMYKQLVELIDSVKDKDYKRVLEIFFVEDKSFAEAFKTTPAGMRIHHAYIGGLLEHSLNVAKIIDKVCVIYDKLDRDLLIAGALLHDIGKVKEYTINQKGIEITTEGELIGHIIMGVEYLDRKVKGIPYDKLIKLKHLIASHHGEFEWGSPVVPKTPEALVLHFIENMDSKLNRVFQIMDKENDGKEWSEYDTNLSRRFLLK
ncbi:MULTISPECIES: 3'-5' exoribonuclease YhaM family protein [Fervidobacterium]|uniref:Metal dependent phosphohydrolase n=1 Tax=Fervidobacterium nodosum (strain ATCC 35602 / DSM 5306 / Rt17-B1) TaxID=381764 RepID=A7HLU2_FERNB|nr:MULTISPECIES: HD domain-containing protein [Fervidobacterium]ABS60875.1 metal dependent phosphohydrolase [Fervidobacterium nodosum Rt17-B1]KAF2962069.1 phosphohydrolase [Fervidobacterium sp. 2310opik-2]PHJ13806.1 phosphohydrolase [Fervidobacterium sp. SC_NGM5_G05]HOJ94581.1 HD domain-containing protein [Fervidobacterium nodosum]